MDDVDNGPVRTKCSNVPELWASHEVCESLGWTRHQLKLERDAGRFPEPVAAVAGGRIDVWDAADVRAWAAETQPEQRRREWRRAEAVRMYRRGMIQAEICRQLRAKPDTIRNYLKAAGETLPRERRSDA